MKYVNLQIRLPELTRLSALKYWLPSRGNVLFTLLVVTLLLLAQAVGALPTSRLSLPASSSTSTIAYQGRLADADGNPLTDTVNMIFRLYDLQVGSAPLWEEQWTGSNGVQVSDGLFNVMLGSLEAIPQNVVTSNDALWLGITVGTDDEMDPRVQLGTVPFAVQALTVPDDSVITEKIADGAVTQAKLGQDVSMVPPDGSVTTEKIADGAVTDEKLNARVPRLLAHDTCDDCGTTAETLAGWNPVKGASTDDIMEVTTVTDGGPVLVHITARYKMNPAGQYLCSIQLLKDGNEVKNVRLEGNPYSTDSTDWACSGSYLFTDLPADTYTFRIYAWVGSTAKEVKWVQYRQIAAFQY